MAHKQGGAISGGPSTIAAGIIARDLGLKSCWRVADARAALEEMAGRAVA